MLKSLETIIKYKENNLKVLKENKWLKYLALTKEQNVNFEKLSSIDLESNLVLNYVERTLNLLNGLDITDYEKSIIEEVLQWSEVSKCGLPHQRKIWESEGVNLFAHNEGSATIYSKETHIIKTMDSFIVETLINTHGLIGQALRGEVNISSNLSIHALLNKGYINKETLKTILYNLNYCIVGGVSLELWNRVEREVSDIIVNILENNCTDYTLEDRIKRLRSISHRNGENFTEEFRKIFIKEEVKRPFENMFRNTSLWYVESALHDFTLEEFVKIILLTLRNLDTDTSKQYHISFEKLMKQIYYNYLGTKKVNIYRKRIIEKYLAQMSIEDILSRKTVSFPHVKHSIEIKGEENIILFDFEFSSLGSKIIEFCVEAEKNNNENIQKAINDRAINLLLDVFELRRDEYDRLHNEESYLNTMNSTINHKKIILDYIVGNSVLDIGPGGGALLDLVEETYPDKTAMGIDISQNVVETLKKKIQKENRKYSILQGDAFKLKEVLKNDNIQTIDTIYLSSIIHELYSYIETEGHKFNKKTIENVLKSCFEVIPEGGRIIIRDGIMTEPKEQNRIIEFLSKEGMEFLKRYSKDFKGRQIQYSIIGDNKVKMLVNDAMEFLYTYTWGEESYAHEINEQFGYFTPSEYIDFIKDVLGSTAEIVTCKHYLQEGYQENLETKIKFYNEQNNVVNLPDSTCFIVIEKQK